MDGLPNLTYVDITFSRILPLWTAKSDASLARLKTFHDTILVPTDKANAPNDGGLVQWNHDHFDRMINLEDVLLRFTADKILVISLNSLVSLAHLRVFDVHFTISGPASFWSVHNCIDQLDGMSLPHVEELRLSVTCGTGWHQLFNKHYVHSLYNENRGLVPLFFSAFPNVRFLTLRLKTCNVYAGPSISAAQVGAGRVLTPDWLVGHVRKDFPAVAKISIEFPTFAAGDVQVVSRLAELLGQGWSVRSDQLGIFCESKPGIV